MGKRKVNKPAHTPSAVSTPALSAISLSDAKTESISEVAYVLTEASEGVSPTQEVLEKSWMTPMSPDLTPLISSCSSLSASPPMMASTDLPPVDRTASMIITYSSHNYSAMMPPCVSSPREGPGTALSVSSTFAKCNRPLSYLLY